MQLEHALSLDSAVSTPEREALVEYVLWAQPFWQDLPAVFARFGKSTHVVRNHCACVTASNASSIAHILL